MPERAFAVSYPASSTTVYESATNAFNNSAFVISAYNNNRARTTACFDGIALNQGEIITSATIGGLSQGDYSNNPATATITMYDVDNAPLVDTLGASQTAHATMTTAFSTWTTLPNFTTGQAYTSPNFATSLQEVVDRAGWISGNRVCVLLDGLGSSTSAIRVITKASTALIIDTTVPPTPTPTPTPPPPTPTPTPTITPIPTATPSATLQDEVGFQFLGQIISFSIGLISYVFLATSLGKLR